MPHPLPPHPPAPYPPAPSPNEPTEDLCHYCGRLIGLAIPALHVGVCHDPDCRAKAVQAIRAAVHPDIWMYVPRGRGYAWGRIGRQRMALRRRERGA